MIFLAAVFGVAVLSGATASLVGFGIGSMLTPLLALHVGTELAVAAVAIPHAVATALRCWRLRREIDWQVLKGFGILSSIGGLAGAFAYSQLDAVVLTRVLGGLLVLTAVAQLAGLATRWHPRGALVGVVGFASGFFGGIAGNQGGLRAAALTAFRLSPLAFVATSTATGLLVDTARAPIYLYTAGAELRSLWIPIAMATAGVLVGTILGERILLGMPRDRFARLVAVAIGILGLWLLLF